MTARVLTLPRIHRTDSPIAWSRFTEGARPHTNLGPSAPCNTLFMRQLSPFEPFFSAGTDNSDHHTGPFAIGESVR